MRIDKTEIIDIILTRGDDETAERANRELPDEVDTEQAGEQLERYGVGPQDVADRITSA